MQLRTTDGIRYYEFDSLAAVGVVHGILARHGGVSPAPYYSLNLSISTGDTRANVRANRERAFQALGRAPGSLADLWQVHSADVVAAEAPNGTRDYQAKADALVTDRPEVTLFLRFADCVPILVYDPIRRAVGLAHAGWRGTLLDMAGATVRALMERYRSRPADLLAAVGPAIGPCHYAVGPEVVEAVQRVFGRHAQGLLHPENGSVHLDLWAANAHCLRAAGVEQIEVAGLCTACNTGDFYSHRAEQGRTGRFGALIALGEPVGRWMATGS